MQMEVKFTFDALGTYIELQAPNGQTVTWELDELRDDIMPFAEAAGMSIVRRASSLGGFHAE